MGMVSRFEVWRVNLDPTIGGEIQKTRPCVVISPDEMSALRTVLVAPMTTGGHQYAMRVPVAFGGKHGHVVLDQIRAVDKTRLIKKLGVIDKTTALKVLATLREMFTE
jgi:mRNA interferase MazF